MSRSWGNAFLSDTRVTSVSRTTLVWDEPPYFEIAWLLRPTTVSLMLLTSPAAAAALLLLSRYSRNNPGVAPAGTNGPSSGWGASSPPLIDRAPSHDCPPLGYRLSSMSSKSRTGVRTGRLVSSATAGLIVRLNAASVPHVELVIFVILNRSQMSSVLTSGFAPS